MMEQHSRAGARTRQTRPTSPLPVLDCSMTPGWQGYPCKRTSLRSSLTRHPCPAMGLVPVDLRAYRNNTHSGSRGTQGVPLGRLVVMPLDLAEVSGLAEPGVGV